MNKDVIITIDDRHEIDGETEEASLTTVGEFSQDKSGYELKYNELDDFKGSVTTVRYDNSGVVTMTRRGTGVSQLIIEKDRRYSCLYATEFDDLMLGVFGKEIISHLGADSGELIFKYTLDFNSGFCSENELKLSFKNADNTGKDATECQSL